MGSIGHRYENGEQSASKGLFNNLIMLTRVDGKVDDAEIDLLARIARRLSLTDEEVKEIIRNPDEYPMIPPSSKEERFERFILFVEMIYIDENIDAKELVLISKYGIALGFQENQIENQTAFIIEKLKESNDPTEILNLMM